MYNAPSASYASSRSPPMEAYRGSPGPMSSRSQFSASSSSLLSPPSVPANGFSPVPSGQGARYPMAQQQAVYARTNPPRYGTPPAGLNGGPGYPQYPQQPQQLPPAKHKGTLAPGQTITVGQNQVRIERYLSEGGFAHVYLTTSERPIYPPLKEEKKGRWGEKGYTQHCLKRIAFQDESVWTDVKKEIEVMKSLPPNPHLTQYLGSAHSKLPNGGYEVFILMEFCAGGGIIDLLNKRLRDRLKEAEILNIFTDVCEAVAAMHSLPRPLLHRDLKIENVLSQPTGSSSSPSRPMGLIFKLCDFGSTTFPALHPPNSKLEADALALDLNKNTTLQYRSPEMVEPMLGQAVGLPSDVWALGVLLYKLCYYTTPFEEHGTLAIVNAKYSFPQYPVYSPKIQHLIASMLVEHPQRRPTVFEVLKNAHDMSGTRPLVDYPTPSRAINGAASSHQRPAAASHSSTNLLDFTSPTSSSPNTPSIQPNVASNIVPQRRGRPTGSTPQRDFAQPVPPLPQPPKVSQPTSSAFKATPPGLQITGDAADSQSTRARDKPTPSPSSSVDAFGAPNKSSSVQPPSTSGFGESFSGRKPFVPTSKFGEQLQREYSGFSDSFGSKKPSAVSTSSTHISQASSLSGQGNSFTSGQKTASPPPMQSDMTPPANRTEQESEVSFETRFPSLEELDADHPTDEPPPTSRPGMRSQPSLIGNLTGGDLASPKIPIIRQDGMPQPRSTHVTGTAFKHSPDEGLSVRERSEYFERGQPEERQAESEKQGPALDLLTGAEDSMGEPLIIKDNEGSRPVAEYAGAPEVHTGTAPLRSSTMSSSSDDNEGPESASAAYKPITSPAEEKEQQVPVSAPPTTGTRSQPPPTLAKPANLRPTPANDRSRSQMMPSAASVQEPSPPPVAAADRPGDETPRPSARPSHERKGSVTDITARFEQLNSPASQGKQDLPVNSPSAESSPVLSKKPSIATKPVNLRQTSIDTGLGKSDNDVASSPTKTKAPPPKTAAKPQALRRTSKFGDAPTPTSYGRSSSGRSFPIHRAPDDTIATDPSKETPAATMEEKGSQEGEERQSVNSLIARWNQGDVAKKTMPPKRGGIV